MITKAAICVLLIALSVSGEYFTIGCKNYQIRAGDTCKSLSDASSNYFYKLNPDINCNYLQIGQSVCLPYGSNYATMNENYSGCQNYKIQKGDTCASMASKAGVSLSQLINLNDNLNCNNLQVDQNVCLPTGTAGTKTSGSDTGSKCKGKQYNVKYGDTCWSICLFGRAIWHKC